MDVQVDGELIRSEREKRAWSQEHLAGAAGIGVRTVQRIEATGVASYESARAISAVLEIPVSALRGNAVAPPSIPRVVGEPSDISVRTAVVSAMGRLSPTRTRSAGRWFGTTVALAIVVAGTSGFLLLKDYQKVRLLRTLEHWVTSDVATSAAN